MFRCAVRLALVFSVLAVALGKSGILFSESFDEGDVFASGKWTKSSDEKYAGQPVLVKASDKAAKGFSDDKGLSLTQEMIDACKQHKELVDLIMGLPRETNLEQRALCAFPMLQTMAESDSRRHVTQEPNRTFVQKRENGSFGVTHCWPVKHTCLESQ